MKFGKLYIGTGFFFFIALVLYFDCELILIRFLVAGAIHEYGHILAIKLCGGGVDLLKLSPFGAEIILCEDRLMGYAQELFIYASGPLSNILVSIIASTLGHFTSWEAAYIFSGINLTLGLFNLMPVRFLDGGNILSSLSGLLLGRRVIGLTVISYMAIVSLFALGVVVLINTGFNISVIIMAVWLFVKDVTYVAGPLTDSYRNGSIGAKRTKKK